MFLMNALPTNQPTDRPTDTVYYRDARRHLETYGPMDRSTDQGTDKGSSRVPCPLLDKLRYECHIVEWIDVQTDKAAVKLCARD